MATFMFILQLYFFIGFGFALIRFLRGEFYLSPHYGYPIMILGAAIVFVVYWIAWPRFVSLYFWTKALKWASKPTSK